METKRGGLRTGAGRKKVDDKKEPITIYVKGSKIKKKGIDKLKKQLTAIAEK